ncbi:ABC transporter ATP-binding protein [Paenibacillus chondroitinus]|uniref:ABC transporter ATP-binding protein n=1 Tax=Paenibacillus chondroitinus TaxID=59842 RepID=A0ABU6D844_9BACL|nr:MULTISPECIES: ABC transporter ATP-binding protein [Paenibacillus]MCY9661834.1 ABC transporter ATP-binding protein [Paenibacillus anseongense]MEB4793920.1 ABC transporter ATP-binding protein [Paenibacillus chondroitinus]
MNTEKPMIQIVNVSKKFGDFDAISQVSLDIPAGSFTTLLGPSGCGKTTLMRLIAGFHEPDAGNIFIEGKNMNELPVYKRNTPLVFQEYALFPHMTVFENIAYGLKLQRPTRQEVKDKVDAMLSMFGLQGLHDRIPRALSGGQQQRVAFARALVMGQKVLLMDEPLSNLDAKMRVEVRDELRELQQRLGITAIFVTHDQDEALSISDRIAVFNKGRIGQVGTPWDIYFKPESKFVADFVGTANFIEGEVAAEEGEDLIVKCGTTVFRVYRSDYRFRIGDRVTVVIRPECISFVDKTTEGHNVWSGVIQRSSFLGRMIRYWINDAPLQWIVDDSSPSMRGYLEGTVHLALDKHHIHLLPFEKDTTTNER